MKRFMLLVVCLTLFVCGCEVLSVIDPNTGQPVKVYRVNPEVSAAVETVGETAVNLLPLFGAGGAAAATGVAGALAAWRKVKPKLETYRTESEHYRATSAAIVEAIEEFKNTNPEQWDKLKGQIHERLAQQGLDPQIIEAVIQGLRDAIGGTAKSGGESVST